MKDSGIEWIGEIPENWKINKLKYLFNFYKGLSIKKTDLREKGIGILSYGQIHSEENTLYKFNPELIRYVSKNKVNFSNNAEVQTGDFIFADTSEDLDGCGNNILIDTNNKLFAGYHSIVLKKKSTIYSKYFSYLFSTDEWRKQIRSKVFGVKVFSITQHILRNISVLVPPYDEQIKIANFLDQKCSEIDNLISDIKKQIELLEEYKRSVITEAVTKGLDPNVEMKDSGVEWIGEIPKDWELKKLKYIFQFSKGLSITKADLVEEGLGVLSYGQIHSKENTTPIFNPDLIRYISEEKVTLSDNSKVQFGDFIFADTSEDLEGCGNNILIDHIEKLYAGYHSIVLKKDSNNYSKYFAYLFNTDLWRKQIRSRVSGVKVYSITQTLLKNMSVLIPSLSEQKEIAEYLDDIFENCYLMQQKMREQIEKLEKYKKSLIFEYVTGKKEVPDE